jgi:hypothetical protein
MRIDDNHLYHGAALIQIAEHEQFTAINSLMNSAGKSRSAYRINTDIAVYLKYAAKPAKSYDEFIFTFQERQLDELAAIANSLPKLFLAMVCVREICCLPYQRLIEMIAARERERGGPRISTQFSSRRPFARVSGFT